MERNFNKERAKSIIAIVVTAVVTVVNMYGYAVDAEAWINAILTFFNALCILYSWWFNQDVTKEAFEGTNLTRAKKEAKHAA